MLPSRISLATTYPSTLVALPSASDLITASTLILKIIRSYTRPTFIPLIALISHFKKDGPPR